MSNKLRKMEKQGLSRVFTKLGANDFHKTFTPLEHKFSLVQNKLENVQPKKVYGIFDNDSDYLLAVDALIASTYETEHRNHVLFTKVLPKIKYTNHFLDIGVGNGDLTKFFGQHFSKISVLDPSEDALSNVPNFLGSNNASVIKIKDSVLNYPPEIFNEKYDFILLSHVLYYIPDTERLGLIKKLYSLLSDHGSLVAIYNSGGERHSLCKNFNPNFNDFSPFSGEIMSNFNSSIYEIEEFLTTSSLENMMHIMGVSLNDAGATASRDELSLYLTAHNLYEENNFQVSMTQNIIILGDHD